MKKIIALAVAGFFCSTPAFALSEEETAYTISMISSLTVAQKCPGYEIVPGAVGKWGDQNGVDVVKTGAAVEAAIAAIMDKEYQRSDLIPGVTRLVNSTINALVKDLTKSEKAYCRNWGKILVDRGFMTKN